MKIVKIIIIVLIGFTISILSGLLGIGGGALMVPAMVYLLGMSQHRAHGTSLAVMSPVALLTAIYYASHGQVNWVIAVELAIGGVIGAAMGAKLCARCSALNLRRGFGILLLLMGVKMILDALGAPIQGGGAGFTVSPSSLIGVVLITGLGVVAGVLSGLLGIGGGLIMIPAMVLLLGVSQIMAQGISLAVIIPVSISGALIHAKQGNVNATMGAWLASGGILGALLGARIAIGMDPMLLHGTFAILMLAMGTANILRKPAE